MMAVLEGEYLSGSVDEALMLRIGNRFSREGLLTEPSTQTMCAGLSTP